MAGDLRGFPQWYMSIGRDAILGPETYGQLG